MVPESEIEQAPMEPENTIGKFPILQKKLYSTLQKHTTIYGFIVKGEEVGGFVSYFQGKQHQNLHVTCNVMDWMHCFHL